jgi:hypothetical protein
VETRDGRELNFSELSELERDSAAFPPSPFLQPQNRCTPPTSLVLNHHTPSSQLSFPLAQFIPEQPANPPKPPTTLTKDTRNHHARKRTRCPLFPPLPRSLCLCPGALSQHTHRPALGTSFAHDPATIKLTRLEREQCRPGTISWQGGRAPYFVSVVRADEPCGDAMCVKLLVDSDFGVRERPTDIALTASNSPRLGTPGSTSETRLSPPAQRSSFPLRTRTTLKFGPAR